MMKTSLVILTGSATNMNETKFFEPIGPNGEILLEYSIFDAIEAGFKKVILIATDAIKRAIRLKIHKKFKNRIQIHWVNIKPQCPFRMGKKIAYESFDQNCYAIWKAKKYIKGSFLVIGSKFYYGKDIFKKAIDFLRTTNEQLATINVPLGRALSPYGSVEGCICYTEKDSNSLARIVALKKLRKINQAIVHNKSSDLKLSEHIPSTIDIYCLNTKFFKACESLNATSMPTGGKISMPQIIEHLLDKKVKIQVLTVNTKMFSIQFKPERILARYTINALMERKLYPIGFAPSLKKTWGFYAHELKTKITAKIKSVIMHWHNSLLYYDYSPDTEMQKNDESYAHRKLARGRSTMHLEESHFDLEASFRTSESR